MPKNDEPRSRRPCCMVSEVLEEAGIDRARVRALRRQLLEGLILLCRWQLERLGSSTDRGSSPSGSSNRARRIRLD